MPIDQVNKKYQEMPQFDEGYTAIKLVTPSAKDKNNLKAYSIKTVRTEECSKSRYILSIIATVSTLGLALSLSTVRQALFDKKHDVKKTLPLKLDLPTEGMKEEERTLNQRSHALVHNLWKKDIHDPIVNKVKLLELERKNARAHSASLVAKHLNEVLDSQKPEGYSSYLSDIKSFKDLEALKYYLLAAQPTITDEEINSIINKLKTTSPLFIHAANTSRYEKFIREVTNQERPKLSFNENVDVHLFTPGKDEVDLFTLPANYNDRFLSNQIAKEGNSFFKRSRFEPSVARGVRRRLGEEEKEYKNNKLRDVNFIYLITLSDPSYKHIFFATRNFFAQEGSKPRSEEDKNPIIPVERMPRIPMYLAGLVDVLLQTKDEIGLSTVEELKAELLSRLDSENIQTVDIDLESFRALVKKKKKISSDVENSPDKDASIQLYNKTYRRYKRDLKKHKEDPATHKAPVLQWPEGETKSITLVNIDEYTLGRVKEMIDNFFADENTIHVLSQKLSE